MNSTHPDLSYTALIMSKKNKYAKIKDLRDISRILKKAKERPSKMKFSRIGPIEDLMVVGIGDTSFKANDKAVGRVFFFTNTTTKLRLLLTVSLRSQKRHTISSSVNTN